MQPFQPLLHARPFRIGITGGIGTGKTTVCKVFETLGIPVYYADYWAKWLIENDAGLIGGITQLLGEAAYQSGQYNRQYVAQIVFQDKAKLAALNALVHPAVERHSRAWHEEQTHAPYTLKEAALMVESGSHRHLDGLIVVTAPETLRIERVVARDGIPEAAVKARIANQMPEAEKLELANWVIQNDGEQPIVPQVWALHQILK